MLLEAGADTTQRNGDLDLPLHIACQHGHLDVVKQLLVVQVEVDARGKQSRTALSVACELGFVDIAKVLLDKGANPNLFDEHFKTPLHYAAEYGHDELVNLMTDTHYASHRNFVKLRTPLHWAALGGQEQTCRMLLGQGDDVNALDANDDSPLILACIGNHPKVIELLLQFNAKVDIVNNFAKTALHYLKAPECLEMMSHSLKTRMFQAVERENLGEITLLLNLGLSTECKDRNENTPLFCACRRGAETVVERLLSCGADPNSQNTQGVTPVMEAGRCLQRGIVRLLLNNSVKPPDLSIQDRFGRTVVDIVTIIGIKPVVNPETRESPISRIRSIFRNIHRNSPAQDTLPLSPAAAGVLIIADVEVDIPPSTPTPTSAPSLLEPDSLPPVPSPPIVKPPEVRMVSNKTSITRATYEDLHRAAKIGDFARVKALVLEYGRALNLNVKVVDKDNKHNVHSETPLYVAAQNGHTDVVRFLLQARASGSIPNANGSSPIFVACYYNHIDVHAKVLGVVQLLKLKHTKFF
eukprot:gene23784-30052_t